MYSITQSSETRPVPLQQIDRVPLAASERSIPMAGPVFYDPRRARWKRLRRLFDVSAVFVSALVIFFVYTALRDEPLPELLFSPQKRAFKALKESEKEKARDRQKKLAARSHRKSKLAASQVKLNQEEGIRAAFYVPWDAASISSLRDYGRQIDILYPDWLHVLTADGHLQGIDDQTSKFFDVVQGSTVRPVDDRVMPLVNAEDPSMEVFPMVNNFDGAVWVGGVTGFLNNPDARATLPPPGSSVSFFGPLPRVDGRLRSLPAQRAARLRGVAEGIVGGLARPRNEAVRRGPAAQWGIRLSGDRGRF